MYTVEVYKQDRRTKSGERLVKKVNHLNPDKSAVSSYYNKYYPVSRGYRFEIHETLVIRRNAVTGQEFLERYDTPYSCSPSSETYWSS